MSAVGLGAQGWGCWWVAGWGRWAAGARWEALLTGCGVAGLGSGLGWDLDGLVGLGSGWLGWLGWLGLDLGWLGRRSRKAVEQFGRDLS